MIIIFTVTFLASLLLALWLYLFFAALMDDWVAAAKNKVAENIIAIEHLREKDAASVKLISKYHGISAFVMGILYKTNSEPKMEKLSQEINALKCGNLKPVNVLPIPGYVLMRKYSNIGKGAVFRKIMEDSYELYGKKYAQHKATDLLAKLISYPILGISVTLMLGAILLGLDNSTAGLAATFIGSALMITLVYAMYDQLSDRLNKRRCEIRGQLPNVVSKLALLVTSGMIMERAWRETANSQDGVLYKEMRAATEQLENLVSPESAYANFIIRCNTKETAKLASAIMQNLSKGNAEIGRVLKDMACDAWHERRHIAKRNAEKAASKLMIPTMLLFLAILIMLMVPIAMNFSAM